MKLVKFGVKSGGVEVVLKVEEIGKRFAGSSVDRQRHQ
ncbi:hypothetical protein CIPAW_09G172900 [Carya illinoinensis]|uniref:Uncharacterized protein n=1 Tax=Carya illinoinensis TaxID=32201 RepID=A0A8T1PRE8_CARIL|nr:hypothetical protein CIPAW_09G172900 [Carya illinoinensis]